MKLFPEGSFPLIILQGIAYGQDVGSLVGRELLHTTELALDGAGTFSHHFFQLVSGILKVFLYLFKHASEFAKFRLYGS